MKTFLENQVKSGSKLLVKIQEHRTPNRNIFFHLCTELGNGIGSTLSLGIIYWTVDQTIGRQIVLLWGISMWIGGFWKEYFQLPRPSLPVTKLETTYELEYGFPSSHTYNAFVCSLFLVWKIFMNTQNLTNFYIGLILAIIYSTLISFSRLYRGVHSPIDVIGGFFLAIFTLIFWIIFEIGNNLDNILIQNPVFIVPISILVILLYPNKKEFNTSFTDVVSIMALTTGLTVGSFLIQIESLPNIYQFCFRIGFGVLQLVIGEYVVKGLMKYISISPHLKNYLLHIFLGFVFSGVIPRTF